VEKQTQMDITNREKPPGILNLLLCKCPRCREGDMFVQQRAYSKGFMKMHDTCAVCGQYFDLEVGFYYGSGYVSYGMTVAFSVATFLAWWALIGISPSDNRVFYWLTINSLMILVLQPIFMRLARVFWLAVFVKYDPDWGIHPAEVPERTNDAMKNTW
jgi:uncharacterized protein (DUF983 family)